MSVLLQVRPSIKHFVCKLLWQYILLARRPSCQQTISIKTLQNDCVGTYFILEHKKILANSKSLAQTFLDVKVPDHSEQKHMLNVNQSVIQCQIQWFSSDIACSINLFTYLLQLRD